jgi:cytoplasmic iron level regulating protein YaaA (DUF328/UPF0246 family)
MIIVISPAKNINFDKEYAELEVSKIRFREETKEILYVLKQLSDSDIKNLMKISNNLSQLNFERFQNMDLDKLQSVSKPSLLVFNGAVFQNMNLDEFGIDDLKYSQSKLRILSGFYGLLRPLDGIIPYRLEMGTALKVKGYNNLYKFWGDKITDLLQSDLDDDGDKVLINLASNEYFKSINTKKLDARVITIEFKEYKDEKYKTIAIYAKMARGKMSNYILKNRINNPDEIKLFSEDGYQYNDIMSEADKWVFVR